MPDTLLLVVVPVLVFSLVMLIRALPLGAALQRKPLSCDVCMSFWVALAVTSALPGLYHSSVLWAVTHAATGPGGALLLLQLYRWLSVRELPLP